ncbi:MAG: hypothetical protein JXK16_11300, partial [Thiotrichales bacterium]|nr:hypothetical protein [Thiotrichales bacterium]
MRQLIEAMQKNNFPFIPQAVFALIGSVLKTEKLPNLFEDSTHQIWRLQTAENCYALKKCPANLVQLETAVFWRGVFHLWGLDLPKQLGGFADVYAFLAKYSGLQVPPLLRAQSSDDFQEGWLLNAWMLGFQINQSTPKLIQQLAIHLASLHSQTQQSFGGMIGQQMPLTQWGPKVFDTLIYLAEQNQVVLPLSESAMQALRNWVPQNCVPVMLDLRWDQFLQSEQGD